jgi:hypothetical protein
VVLGVVLVLISAALYAGHWLVFRDAHHIFIYMLGDIAFVPIYVLLATIVLARLLTLREQRSRRDKLNMVVGTFFSEVGTSLLAWLARRDPGLEDIRRELVVERGWTRREFDRVATRLRDFPFSLRVERNDLPGLEAELHGHRDFLLRLLENPSLIENEEFTELLRAVFHLVEELDHRDRFESLPDTDIAHLQADAMRAYGRLVRVWLEHMRYLKDRYPYLFSLAVRTNPFDPDASPVVTAPPGR